MGNKIADILRDSEHRLSLFPEEHVKKLEKSIIDKNGKPHVKCIIRDKEIQLKPEEIVRQLYLMELIYKYEYPKDKIRVEHSIHFGREKKQADIVIMDPDRINVEYIIVEVKKPKLFDGKAQLRSYANATGAPIAVWTNGEQISRYNRRDPNYFEDISDIPKSHQTLADVLAEDFTIKDLMIRDRVANERIGLKDIILEMEDEVLANAGVDVFEEVFKLIFAKLYDEVECHKADQQRIDDYLEENLEAGDMNDYQKIKALLLKYKNKKLRLLEFRNSGQTDSQLKEKIQGLFEKANKKWEGIFDSNSQIQLSPSHLSVCVASLQHIKLYNSNLQVIDEAFEYLVNKSAKGEKGQYFTPRHVIDMCVKMLNPHPGEYMIDTAAGSCGFPVHTIFHIDKQSNNREEDISKIFGIDFDEKVVRVARTLNLIAGDGNTNVLRLNNLDYEPWGELVDNPEWRDVYGKGFRELEKIGKEKKSYKEFNFDIVMANPPFAGDIKEARIIGKYQLGLNEKDNPKKNVGRDILFIERNLNFLKPGGRMAIVLPQGRFNNISDRYIRDHIANEARILAVVDLHVNTFKPHTAAKTSVLFLQKWPEDAAGKPIKSEDYEIFFAVSEYSGKDNSGDYVYEKDEYGNRKLDKQGRLIIKHDLHSHEGNLSDGVAEAFIQWARNQGLSFLEE